MKEFKRVLVANRGEIALRIIRALKSLELESVAVYSDADSSALHVTQADLAFRLPGVYPNETYLNGKKIVETATASDCDAIHPGYGFLAESSEFSTICEEKSIKFIGPKPQTLEISGNKLECKKLVESRGVPVIPYSREPLEEPEQALKAASEVGFPVLLKSAFGGGGRGIREAKNKDDVRDVFESAQREAKSAFGRFSIYVEKKLVNPRHIEVQIMSTDDSSEFVHLNERECSIQRRFQKLIELSPSPVVDEETRKKITSYGIAAAKACHYSNAGTVEMLRDSETGNFYFMEMNSRLQVEHPVTESVTGTDLVSAQVLVAEGKKLPFRQRDVKIRGSAIECRINAEDPIHDFAPTTGTVEFLHLPSGPGIRVDTALCQGMEISPYYDSLIAKVISWGVDFEQARTRLLVALNELAIYGVETSTPFHQAVLQDDRFIRGEFDTGFVESSGMRKQLEMEASAVRDEDYQIAALLLSRNMFYEPRKSMESRRTPAWVKGGKERYIDAL